MKLNSNSQVYINCKTQEERDMIIDILRALDCTWATGRGLDYHRFCDAPMHIELNKLAVRHGIKLTTQIMRAYPYPIVEAKDLRNQWISIRRNIDK